MITPKQIELIKLIIARFKSKSPKGYQKLLNICILLSSIMGTYILIYNCLDLTILSETIKHILGVIDNLCIIAGAAFSALGIGAASTTTDPNLISKDVKDNIKKIEC